VKKFIQKAIRHFQHKLAKNGVYIARTQQWNSYDLISEIHENFLQSVTGIIHIGGHAGQEASFYSSIKKNVIWVEAVPVYFQELKVNISNYPNQRAINCLLGDRNADDVLFNIASNNGGSSSIYDFDAEHNFTDVSMTSQIRLTMKRLDSILTNNEIENFGHWVLDVQGAELGVLQGSGNLLSNCRSIYVEVSRRAVYQGGTKWEDLDNFLESKGFTSLWVPPVNSHSDVLYIRKQR
jgi:FkbM family methyltransferase